MDSTHGFLWNTQKKELQRLLSRMWPAISGKLQGWNPPSLLSCVSKEEIHLRPLQSGSGLVSQQYLFSLREVFFTLIFSFIKIPQALSSFGECPTLCSPQSKATQKLSSFLPLAWSHFFWKVSCPWVHSQRGGHQPEHVWAKTHKFWECLWLC